jgi:hypothetical protein
MEDTRVFHLAGNTSYSRKGILAYSWFYVSYRLHTFSMLVIVNLHPGNYRVQEKSSLLQIPGEYDIAL